MNKVELVLLFKVTMNTLKIIFIAICHTYEIFRNSDKHAIRALICHSLIDSVSNKPTSRKFFLPISSVCSNWNLKIFPIQPSKRTTSFYNPKSSCQKHGSKEVPTKEDLATDLLSTIENSRIPLIMASQCNLSLTLVTICQ